MNAPVREIPCGMCQATSFTRWRWDDLESCCVCGHIRRSSILRAGKSHRQLQEEVFGHDFLLYTDLFTRFYDFMNVRRRCRELARVLPAGRVLEVGVGRGKLLLGLRSAGYQVEGLDFSEAICSVLQQRHALRIHNKALEAHANEMSPGSYDAVIMSHVLEHLDDPIPGLLAANHLLNEEGVLYVAVPNVGSWNARWPGWNGYEPYHLHYFHEQTLMRGLTAAGFTVLQWKTIEPLSGWVNTLTRSIGLVQPDVKSSVTNGASRTRTNRIVRVAYNTFRLVAGLALSPLRWVQGMMGYGEELIVIARPNEASTP